MAYDDLDPNDERTPLERALNDVRAVPGWVRLLTESALSDDTRFQACQQILLALEDARKGLRGVAWDVSAVAAGRCSSPEDRRAALKAWSDYRNEYQAVEG